MTHSFHTSVCVLKLHIAAGRPRGAGHGGEAVEQERKSGNRAGVCWQLFVSMLYISACTFGGGFVIVSFMKRRFVNHLHVLEEQEMLDLIALAQSAPGAIAVNAAILAGWRVAGWAGAASAVLGTVIPPLVILSVISVFYEAFATNRYVALVFRGMQAGVAAVITDVAIGLAGKVIQERSALHIALMAAAFLAAFFGKVNAVLILLAAAGIGLCAALWRCRKERRA